jgi:hypothetical protein
MYKSVPVHVSDEYVNAENGDGQEVIPGRVIGIAPSIDYRNDGEGVIQGTVIGIGPSADYRNEAIVKDTVSAHPVSPVIQMPYAQYPHYVQPIPQQYGMQQPVNYHNNGMQYANGMQPLNYNNYAGTVTTTGNEDFGAGLNSVYSQIVGSNFSVVGGLISMIFQWISFAGIIVCAVVYASCTDPFAPCSNAIMGIIPCVFVFIISTVGVWVCACFSSMFMFITNPSGVVKAKEYFTKIPAMEMKIFHRVHCYHTTTEHYTDSDGRSQSRTHTHTLHKAQFEFLFDRSVDVTQFPENIDENSLSIIRFPKSYEFSTPELLARFLAEKQLFETSHMHCDESRTFSEEIRIDGLYHEILSYGSESQIPSIIRNQSWGKFIFLTAFFGISWFVYASFARNTTHVVQVKHMIMDN